MSLEGESDPRPRSYQDLALPLSHRGIYEGTRQKFYQEASIITRLSIVSPLHAEFYFSADPVFLVPEFPL